MNIYYICPDLKSPSGGVKRLYSHVEILRSGGLPAHILHFKKGFRIDWFSSIAPVKYFDDDIQWTPSDVLVFPEGLAPIIKKFKSTPFRKIIIALSHSYIFPQLPMGENWNDYNIEAVITPSRLVKDFVSWSMGIKNVYLFKTSIDHSLFNQTKSIKKLQVAYIPRKDNTAEIIEKIIKSRKTINVNFVKIENKPIEQYAEVLKESAIFLTTSAHEGIHRSVLEAMACGCICIGYDAIGAKEYIIASGDKQNFVTVENMNYIDCAKDLEELVEQIISEDKQISIIRKNALKTSKLFDLQVEKDSILDFWKKFLKI